MGVCGLSWVTVLLSVCASWLAALFSGPFRSLCKCPYAEKLNVGAGPTPVTSARACGGEGLSWLGPLHRASCVSTLERKSLATRAMGAAL